MGPVVVTPVRGGGDEGVYLGTAMVQTKGRMDGREEVGAWAQGAETRHETLIPNTHLTLFLKARGPGVPHAGWNT